MSAGSISWPLLHRALERVLLETEVARTLPEARSANAGALVTAVDATVLIFALNFVEQEILGDDRIAFETEHFGDLGNATRTVTQTLRLDDDVDGGDDDFANGFCGQREAAHRDHRFKTGEVLKR